jgi:exopolysaccharide biosynthesis polyprenyl glycosylphosphotransferase
LLVARYCLSVLLVKMKSKGKRSKVLIVGLTSTGVRLAGSIKDYHSSIYELIGFASDQEFSEAPLPCPIVGKLNETPNVCVTHHIDLVLIAAGPKEYERVELLIKELSQAPMRIYLAPNVLELPSFHPEIERFEDVPIIGIREPVIRGPRRVAKRVFDLVAGSVLLLFTWPLWIIIAIAIKLDSSGPVIFKTERVGQNAKRFIMLKFRSMITEAESLQGQALTKDGNGHTIYKSKDDFRVTRVGKWLRRLSADELPQLINVLRGEMSLVGPRPEQPFIMRDYESSQLVRLAVPPGITGLWQVSGRSDLPLHLNVDYDIAYVRNYSLLLDIKILLKTIPAILRGSGAY